MKRQHPPLPALKTRSAGARCKKFMFSPTKQQGARGATSATRGAPVKIYGQINKCVLK